MAAPLLPARFLFRFSATCRRRDPLWTPESGGLDELYRLPSLAELEGKTAWADVRAAWSEAGIAFAAHVQRKRPPQSKNAAIPPRDLPLFSTGDGLHVWIDTRDVHNVHRAGRFCHRFAFLPEERKGIASSSGATAGLPSSAAGKVARADRGSRRADPTTPSTAAKRTKKPPAKADVPLLLPAASQWLPINRAKELPRPVGPESLQAGWRRFDEGYVIEAFIPTEALTGFDPAEHPRLGFTYAIVDRELGEQTFGVGRPMPFQEDPSLWPTLELEA